MVPVSCPGVTLPGAPAVRRSGAWTTKGTRFLSPENSPHGERSTDGCCKLQLGTVIIWIRPLTSAQMRTLTRGHTVPLSGPSGTGWLPVFCVLFNAFHWQAGEGRGPRQLHAMHLKPLEAPRSGTRQVRHV